MNFLSAIAADSIPFRLGRRQCAENRPHVPFASWADPVYPMHLYVAIIAERYLEEHADSSF
jgi:hypothetical protein